MVERKGGIGGFGAIASDNTDLRKGRYAPHQNVTKFTNFSKDETQLVCLDCGKRWYHPRGKWEGHTPPECQKKGQVSDTLEEEDPKLAELNRKWREAHGG